MNLRELVSGQCRSKLPRLAPHGVVTETTGELALGAVHLAVQVVALHVADDLAVQVQLVQVTATVVQVVDLAPIRQGQRGQVAERVVFITQRTLRCEFLGQAPQQVVGVLQLFLGDAELLADTGRTALNAH